MAAASTTTVDCRFADVEGADPERLVGSLTAKFGAVRDSLRRESGVGTAAVATGVSGVAASRAPSDGTGSAEYAGAARTSVGNAAVGCLVGTAAPGDSAGAAIATPEGIPVWAGVASADAVVSLLDGVALVCAPLELFLIPDVEPDEEAAAEADESVDDVGSVDDVLAADSDEELEADDDEPGELVSVGSANATPGVVATAPPTPSANANTPARIMCCAVTGIALRGQSARAPARWDPAAVKVILATFLVDAVGLRWRLLIARVLSVRAHEVSCRVRAGEVARPADCFRVETSPASPQGAARGSRVRFRWTGWVPRLHPRVFVGVPAQWMEFGAKGRRRPAAGKGSAGLGHDGNVWRRSRHL